MEDKRTLLAIVLSLFVLVGWSYFSDYMGWTPPPAPVATTDSSTSNVDASAQSASQASSFAAASTFTPSDGREVRVDTPLYTAVLYSGGGTLRSFTLKQYAQSTAPNSAPVELVTKAAAQTGPMGLLLDGQPSWSTGQWSFEGEDLTLTEGQSGTLTFTGEVNGVRVSRVLSFNASDYLISETVLLGSNNQQARPVRLSFTVGASNFSSTLSDYDPMRIAWNNDGSFDEDSDASDLATQAYQETGTFLWAGIINNYFLTIVAPTETTSLALKALVQNMGSEADNVWRVGLERTDLVAPATGELPVTVSWWFGPKKHELLEAAPNDMASAVNYGFFNVIASPLVIALNFFYSFVHNWGVAIILLTVCIRAAFWPLSQKSYKSMEQMKKLQPIMAKLREKHANDKETLNREVMQMYKTYGVNPMAGCLPILLQMPVFIGLYQALLNSIELRHATFIEYLPFTDMLWLNDLSAPDPYYVTPLLMGATMFLQQKLSPPAGDPMQQKIMMFLPLIFTVMFLNFPAGLTVYWTFNNILSIAQQWLMTRKA